MGTYPKAHLALGIHGDTLEWEDKTAKQDPTPLRQCLHNAFEEQRLD